MFYYPSVLQRHTGCFATIWLAATRGTRLVKREYLKVNVVKTCEEILNYVLVRVQPPLPGLPRPRFSLYLSAQLQIGVIRVYAQQCQYLVEDIQHILERLHRAQLQMRIDMVEIELPSLLLPNHLARMETLEDAPDPFFGMMSVEPRLPSPFNIPQIRHLLEAVTPERVLEEIPPEVPIEPERILVTAPSPEAITLLEAEPIRMLKIEGERELPEVSRRDLELLIAEEEEAILLEERRLEYKEELRVPEREITIPPPSPLALAEVEEAAEPLPVQVLAPEELKPPVWEPEALLPEVTPPLELRLPVPLIPERRRPPVAPPPRIPPARRRRRRLLFWDRETQIPREEFREQMQTRAHCRECPMVQPPERMITSPGELFRTPTHSGRLPQELLAFWTHCAQPLPPALRRRPPPEPEEEEAEREAAAEEERRKAEIPSDIEVLREALEPSEPLMLPSEISLEAAEEEKTRISLVPLEERWAWAEAEQLEAPALPVVPELPEVPVEMPVELPPEPELLSLEAVHRYKEGCASMGGLGCSLSSQFLTPTGQWHGSCRPTGSLTSAAWCHLSVPAGWPPGSSTCSWCLLHSRSFV
ncbi:meiotic recombination protein REC8 homolog isoform X1 [Physeter macrocephalus]|uniref:Meiotic recombination protein REC8 homolog isoform X1 n=1 Tax=Physeter macrocephalus TaxID=9755 RepID=A0A455ARA4_PHYMC|nr:meiotic recombination protein REC8 homolog isoform X1 [Physeter catodon]XP_054938086.1 meiotic recombination protein REC8 homolog isoform X1 [Physeter catodon]|eukprot:XP_028339112.1 meiotic recombination protein REC8 homolog isoform X1 [Physeter catodon]